MKQGDEFDFKKPFSIVFRLSGTVWPYVTPYCVINSLLLTGLMLLKKVSRIDIHIMPQGHALMSLLIAYLGVSKVTLAFDRYMEARVAIGHALMLLRELNQLAITLTEADQTENAQAWRKEFKILTIKVIESTISTLQDGKNAQYLARNDYIREYSAKQRANRDKQSEIADDPMDTVHVLRSHLYNNSLSLTEHELVLLERCKMLDLLHEYVEAYRTLLRLASTPLPFALVQMGRTFIFIWSITIPLVLAGEDFHKDYLSAFSFVVLLTYGFLGLEFVAMMLSHPFGDSDKLNDLNIKGMATATITAIEIDSIQLQEHKDSPKQASLRKMVMERTSRNTSSRNSSRQSSTTEFGDDAQDSGGRQHHHVLELGGHHHDYHAFH